MSKGKLAAIIISVSVFVVAMVIVFFPELVHPPRAPGEAPRSPDTPSAEFTITNMEQRSLGLRELYRVQITLLDFLRGEEAWAVLQERSGNEPPSPGFEYILVNVNVELLEAYPSDARSFLVSSLYVHSFSGDGDRYDRPDADPPLFGEYTRMLGSLDPGKSSTAAFVLQVAVDDDKPLVSFAPEVLGYDDGEAQYGSDGEFWFRLYDDRRSSIGTSGLGYDRSTPAGAGHPTSRWVDQWCIGGAPQEPVAEEQWSEFVYAHYDVRNTGATHIGYYEVWFTITYDDGSQYEKKTNGSHLLPGERRSARTICRHEAKEAVSVEVSDYNLRGSEIPEVIYDITGTAEEVFVTLSNAEGGTEQYSSVSVPRRYTYTTFPADTVYISAQNEGASGTVRVSIYLNGELFRTSSSSGAYVIATASGTR